MTTTALQRLLVVFTMCVVGLLASPGFAVAAPGSAPDECRRHCESPQVGVGSGVLTAAYVATNLGGGYTATNAAPTLPLYVYRLVHPCVSDDEQTGACRGSDFLECPAPMGRVVEDLVIQQRALVIAGPDGLPKTDNNAPFDPSSPLGTPAGDWERLDRGCTDITALNPPPSPAEVFRYFQTLPLPQLPTKQQPPGDGLVGLPVIFFTDGPTTQTFTLDIRGFTVDITATASGFTWHTGDGTDLTTSDPGAPYPDQTITHDYASGSYTASLTTTWTATFSLDGGLTVPVPGSTTTDGPAVTFDVLQARPVLTNPYD